MLRAFIRISHSRWSARSRKWACLAFGHQVGTNCMEHELGIIQWPDRKVNQRCTSHPVVDVTNETLQGNYYTMANAHQVRMKDYAYSSAAGFQWICLKPSKTSNNHPIGQVCRINRTKMFEPPWEKDNVYGYFQKVLKEKRTLSTGGWIRYLVIGTGTQPPFLACTLPIT